MKKTTVFEQSIIQLCTTLSKDQIGQLDFILTQDKNDVEIVQEIIEKFPSFRDMYASELTKNNKYD